VKSFALQIADVLQGMHVDYGDVRVIHRQAQEITVTNQIAEVVGASETLGFGVRVLKNGAWGYAACATMDASQIVPTAKRALDVAEASRMVMHERDPFQPPPVVQGTFVTPCKIDPFDVPIDQKVALLLDATSIMRPGKQIHLAKGFLDCYKERKAFVATTGTQLEQEIIQCGGGIVAFATDGSNVQHRSYPSSFRGNFASSGWEFVEALGLAAHAEQVADEAHQLLAAPPCPAMQTTLILEGDQLALQIHESIGHPIELDRIFGYEASFAGTSFLRPDMLGSFHYGSEIVNVTADATIPGGLGTFGYDDEGTPAQRVPIIREGVLVGFLSSCSTAPRLGLASNGTMRADGWQNFPLIRMTNINLEPGTWDRDALIADTKSGLLLQTNKSWSIDDQRINFQFSTEVAREIHNGKLGRLYKNPVYTGITPQFWNSCDAICSDTFAQMWGTPNCGKGEPPQTARVGHRVAPARFRNVRVWGAQ
jgi:TldD protein